MVKIQALLACRPGELVTMKPGEIDRSGAVWIYKPRSHKTEHKGKSRVIPIGPRCQILLKPWLPDDPEQFVFRSKFRRAICTGSYAQMIRRACKLAGVPSWSPNQLRHAGATRIREQASLDAAQIILGHSTVATTQVYAEKNLNAALEIAAKIG
jgi:integrase